MPICINLQSKTGSTFLPVSIHECMCNLFPTHILHKSILFILGNWNSYISIINKLVRGQLNPFKPISSLIFNGLQFVQPQIPTHQKTTFKFDASSLKHYWVTRFVENVTYRFVEPTIGIEMTYNSEQKSMLKEKKIDTKALCYSIKVLTTWPLRVLLKQCRVIRLKTF